MRKPLQKLSKYVFYSTKRMVIRQTLVPDFYHQTLV